jgi:hypothetical protein
LPSECLSQVNLLLLCPSFSFHTWNQTNN